MGVMIFEVVVFTLGAGAVFDFFCHDLLDLSQQRWRVSVLESLGPFSSPAFTVGGVAKQGFGQFVQVFGGMAVVKDGRDLGR